LRLAAAHSTVVFTGAGVSRESGLATFRGEEGLWERFRPEELATPGAFARHPEVVWRWYAWRFAQVARALPNAAHQALERWERAAASFTLVTQNVDGLHQRAGSRRVLELHGSIARARCQGCAKEVSMNEAVSLSPGAPLRCGCGGRFRPAVVWFGELLPADALAQAFAAAERCQLLVSVGTSAQVFPAAGVIEVAHRAGAVIVEVNPEATGFSRLAHWRLAQPAGEVLPALVEAILTCQRPS
jgi:NAD-dependent deacetylase